VNIVNETDLWKACKCVARHLEGSLIAKKRRLIMGTNTGTVDLLDPMVLRMRAYVLENMVTEAEVEPARAQGPGDFEGGKRG
jgi:hypothetical protein